MRGPPLILLVHHLIFHRKHIYFLKKTNTQIKICVGAISGGVRIIIKSGQKKLQHISKGLHKKLQANNTKI